jgi:DNA-binding MarR family transcriptional regulator
MTKRTAGSDLELTPKGRLEEGEMKALLGYLLAQAAIATDSAFERAVRKPLGLGKVEFTIIQLISQNADITPTRLARALAISTPGITAWLDKLAARGLITRQRSETDGRAQTLTLTPQAQAMQAQALGDLLAGDALLLAHLSKGEQILLVELLRKIGHAR